MQESDILHEDAGKVYWVAKAKRGVEVYRAGITHSIRCAIIGYEGAEGMRRALAEIERRKVMDARQNAS